METDGIDVAVKLMPGAYDCRVVDLIIHRLRLLLTSTTGTSITPDVADLLFGPLLEWMSASDKVRQSIPTYADAVPEALQIAGSPDAHHPDHPLHTRFVVALRPCVYWSLYTKHRHLFPPVALFGYYIGIAIDIHMPALGRDDTTIHTIYNPEARTSPESVRIADIYHDEATNPLIPNTLLEELWSEYLNCNRVRSTQPAAKRPRTSSYGASHDNTTRQMLVKCMVKCLNTRYIPKSVRDGLRSTPPNPVVVRTLKSAILGAYKHATTIASPYVRHLVYTALPSDLKDIISAFAPKEAYSLIAEAVCAVTAHHNTLSHILANDDGFESYRHRAITTSDTLLRPYIIDRIKHDGSLKVYSWADVDYNPDDIPVLGYDVPVLSPPLQRVFWELVSVLGIKQHIPCTIHELATGKHPGGVSALYAAFRLQPHTLRIYNGILQKCGMSDADIKVIAKSFINVDPYRVSKHVASGVAALSKHGRAILWLYVHYISTRASIACQPIATRRVVWPASTPGRRLPLVVVCNNCLSVCTHCEDHTITRKKAKTKGTTVVIDVTRDMVVCGKCKSADIGAVDVRHFYVTGPTPHTPSKQVTVCACQMCGKLTPTDTIIGTVHLCVKCFERATTLLVPRHCFCGEVLTPPIQSFVAQHENGTHATFGVCEKHVYVTTMFNPNHVVPIAAYRAVAGV